MKLTGNTNSDYILDILCVENGLTTVQIKRALRAHHNVSLSFQGVRFLLSQLIDKSILIKNNKKYSIRKSWVQDLKEQVNVLDQAVVRKQKMKRIDKNTTSIHLKTLAELGYFVLYTWEYRYADFAKDKNLFCVLDHLWIPFARKSERQRLEEVFARCNLTVCIRGKSAGDVVLSSYYKKRGRLTLGSSPNHDEQYFVWGNTVMHIIMSPKLRKKMNAVYSLKGILKLNLLKNLEAMNYTEYGIDIVISKSKILADKIKKEIKEMVSSETIV